MFREYLTKLNMIKSDNPAILYLVHTKKTFLSMYIGNTCNNIHSSSWTEEKNTKNKMSTGMEMTKTKMWWILTAEYYTAVKNEQTTAMPNSLEQLQNHIKWKTLVPKDYHMPRIINSR